MTWDQKLELENISIKINLLIDSKLKDEHLEERKEINHDLVPSLDGITVLDHGPILGSGSIKEMLKVHSKPKPGGSKCKFTASSMVTEQISSPDYSSSSNSPLTNSAGFQGANSSSMSPLATSRKSGKYSAPTTNANSTKNLSNISDKSKNLTSRQKSKNHNSSVLQRDVVETCVLPSRASRNSSPRLEKNSNSSCPFLSTTMNRHSRNSSPTSSFSPMHSNQDLTNATKKNSTVSAKNSRRSRCHDKNKLLENHSKDILTSNVRTELAADLQTKKNVSPIPSTERMTFVNSVNNSKASHSKTKLLMESESYSRRVHSENPNHVLSHHSNSVKDDKKSNTSRNKKNNINNNELRSKHIQELIAAMPSGKRKVKTTKELQAEWEAKRASNPIYSSETSVDSLHNFKTESPSAKAKFIASNLSSDNSSLNHVSSNHSNSIEGDRKLSTPASMSKRKKNNVSNNELKSLSLLEKLAALPSASKRKIKTTEELRAEWEAKSARNSISSSETSNNFHNFKADVSLPNSKIIAPNLPSENTAFNRVSSSHSNSIEVNSKSLSTSKRKRSSTNKDELQENRLQAMLASLPSGSKRRVKTTQEIIADFQAKNGFNPIPDGFASQNSIPRIKSESPEERALTFEPAGIKRNSENPVNISDNCDSRCPSATSVINANLDAPSCPSRHETIDEEIERILSALPPINPAEINLDDSPSLEHRTPINILDIDRLNDRWEFVNGVYDSGGTWKSWQECCTVHMAYSDRDITILPYVDID
ncbi:hypothetical protein CEXT_663381 [Caerostris extrusa]|uniref:Mediator complex subunit 26 C-terminal domain-containing protein n=1 Tax=Caerostris extrusa TaxID=172846 RepID=A0AAV4RX02_CAEEX|nr:hypothetical protein CEXT_663381 [Caerostris extrusa]